MSSLGTSLNAPCGAGCFLAVMIDLPEGEGSVVLMHLVVLGAFWPPALGVASLRHFRGRSATGSAGTPRDRPVRPLFNHFSAS